jgi:BMFP domain-containing protein YqiC
MTTPIPSEVIEDVEKAGGRLYLFAEKYLYSGCSYVLSDEQLVHFAQLQRLREHSSKEVAEDNSGYREDVEKAVRAAKKWGKEIPELTDFSPRNAIDILATLLLQARCEVAEVEPVYQVNYIDKSWFDVDIDTYENVDLRFSKRRIVYLEPPSSHQAAASMKCFADAVEKLAFSMPAPNPYTPKFVQLAIEAMQAIPTVEESK